MFDMRKLVEKKTIKKDTKKITKTSLCVRAPEINCFLEKVSKEITLTLADKKYLTKQLLNLTPSEFNKIKIKKFVLYLKEIKTKPSNIK